MHNKKYPAYTLVLTIIILALALLSACSKTYSNSSPDASSAGRVKIITVNFPPADFSRIVGKDLVEVRQLLLPGVESHVFEPTPQDIIAIKEADLFIYGGGSSDNWVRNLLEDSEISSENTLIMMDYVTTVIEETTEGMQEDHDHTGDAADDHNHTGDDADDSHVHDDSVGHGDDNDGNNHTGDHHVLELDEHIWTDPENAIKISAAIQNKLIELDTDNAEEYRTNYNAFAKELHELDNEWHKGIASSKRNTLIFADRFPFRYLTDAYELEYYAAFPGCAAETEPNPATIVFLINKVKDEAIPYIFTIEMSNQALAGTVAEATGAEILQLHSLHNLTVEEANENTSYLDLMYKNLENVLKALN